MRKLIGVILATLSMFAFENIEATQTNITKLQTQGVSIIDIRREEEWIQTGIIKGAKTLTFFDKIGNYNAAKFLKDLNTKINKNKKFAIICRTGHRTSSVAPFLKEQGYTVINLLGGITLFKKTGGKFTEYR